MLWCSWALAAAPYSDVVEGWHLKETGQLELANERAVQALHLDPTDVAAHRLYINVHLRGYGDDSVVEQYRRWHADSPEDPAAAVALATALSWQNDEMGPWCEELDRLLEVVPTDPEQRYWALRVQYETRRSCPGMSEAEAYDAVLAETSGSLAHQGYSLRLRRGTGTLDADFVEDLERFYASGGGLSYVGNLWWEELEGEGVEAAQAAMLAQARKVAEGDDPVALREAARVFGYADLAEEQAAAQARHAELDPAAKNPEIRRTGERTWVLRSERANRPESYAIWKASRKAPMRSALALHRIEPLEVADQAAWHEAMAENQLLRRDAHRANLWEAYELEPTDERANEAAYAAALHGRDLDRALQVMDEALGAWGDWDPRGPYWVDGYGEWTEQRKDRLASWLDTRGWVHFARGDMEAARNDLALALLLSPEPEGIYHLHMGLVLHALGQDEQALFHLGRGLALDTSEVKLWWTSHRTAETLHAEIRWTHEDFDDWVAAQLPAEDIGLAPGVDAEVSYRVGMVFPDIAVQVDGVDKHISDFEGIRVVDVWATWCGPCVAGMPKLDRVAEEYAEHGVTVLAVSVDRDLQDVLDFDEGPRRPDYIVGWTGDGGWAELQIRAIPSVFVLDAEGYIVDHWTGGGGQRLERRLDALITSSEDPR